jgi:excisionase family DNA binding protein
MTVEETEAYLKCCHSTVYSLVGRGDLKPRKLGRSTRFVRAEVEAFVAALPVLVPSSRRLPKGRAR